MSSICELLSLKRHLTVIEDDEKEQGKRMDDVWQNLDTKTKALMFSKFVDEVLSFL